MQTSITSNAAQISALWKRRATLVVGAMRAATVEATNAFRRESIEKMNAGIYNKPVPTFDETRRTASRKRPRKAAPLWKRAKQAGLKGNEKQEIISAEQGIVYNIATYARYRHDMPESLEAAGKKWRHGDRTAHWRADTIREWERTGRPREYYQKHLRGVFLGTR